MVSIAPRESVQSTETSKEAKKSDQDAVMADTMRMLQEMKWRMDTLDLAV